MIKSLSFSTERAECGLIDNPEVIRLVLFLTSPLYVPRRDDDYDGRRICIPNKIPMKTFSTIPITSDHFSTWYKKNYRTLKGSIETPNENVYQEARTFLRLAAIASADINIDYKD